MSIDTREYKEHHVLVQQAVPPMHWHDESALCLMVFYFLWCFICVEQKSVSRFKYSLFVAEANSNYVDVKYSSVLVIV